LEFGNFMRPKEYTTFSHPVPMDVPRIRYELLTRQVGHSAPIANAGPPQIGVSPGTITLNGSGSYSPDHDALNYSWAQVNGPSIAISGANTAQATFTAGASSSYGFRLTVTDQVTGLTASADTYVSTSKGLQVVRFTATPPQIASGRSSTLAWNVSGATSVSISGGVGSSLPAVGTATVTPTQTTTYNLTGTGQGGQTVTASVTVTVTGGKVPNVLSFTASPTVLPNAGGQVSLCWNVSNANTITIQPQLGTVSGPANCQTVTVNQTTTFVLTATNAAGPTQASVTVSVGAVQILTFSASPAYSPASGAPVVLSWTTSNATSVIVTGTGVPSGALNVNGSLTVNPTTNSDYTLTAYGPGGPVSSVIHVFVR